MLPELKKAVSIKKTATAMLMPTKTKPSLFMQPPDKL